MDSQICFGKYKNQTLGKIFESNPSYCCWLLKQKIMLSPDQRKYLEDQLQDVGDFIGWGKHKGKSLKWIHSADQDYFKWLLNNAYVNENCVPLHQALMKLDV